MTSDSPALSLLAITKRFRVPRLDPAAQKHPDPRRVHSGRHDYLYVLRDLTFDIPKGQTVGLIGANGSGKTTLLKILAGVTQPDAGTFSALGKVGALLEVGAGFHPDLTGAENVQLNATLLGFTRRQIGDLLPNIISFAELERFMDVPVKHYSSGMVVRLGFAIASQLEPEILLLDETFAVGDARFQARALSRVQQLRDSGTTLILVSHTADLILQLADRVIWLDHGRVARDGDPDQVVAEYRRYCGARLMGCDYLSVKTPFEWAAEGVRKVNPAIRFVEAKIEGAGKGRVVDLESTDRLSIQLEIEALQEINPDEYEIEAVFLREDSRAVASSTTALAELLPGAARSAKCNLTYDPVLLARGEYEVNFSILRRDDLASPVPIDAVTATGRLRIVTPLPYNSRFIVNLDAQWLTK